MLNSILDINPIVWVGQKIFANSKLLSNLAQFFSSIVAKNAPKSVEQALFGLGVASMTYSAIKSIYAQYCLWGWLPEYYRNKKSFNPQQFRARYGLCTILITGGANGIGLSFAKEFAKMGYDLILTDNNEELLERRKRELEEGNSEIKVLVFNVDMSNEGKMKEFNKQLEQLSKTVDIGIVINNVGMTAGGNYYKINPELIKRQLFLNFKTMYKINQTMIPILRKRNHRSAIINLSSALSVYFSPCVGAYSATKRATDIYSRTIAVQNKDTIDILSVRPFGVITNMMGMRKKDLMITPQVCAHSTLEQLGHTDAAFPSFQHKLQAGALSLMPI